MGCVTSEVAALEGARSGRSNRERDDGYHAVVLHLGHDWRVIVCADRLQWIVQRRRGAEWRGRSYHAERVSLIAACDAYCGPLGARERATLATLPERFRRRAHEAPDEGRGDGEA